MSLDVYLSAIRKTDVYEANITHNLNTMADALGIYQAVWDPETSGIKTAQDLIEPLRSAIAKMEAEPQKYDEFNAENGWGTREQFVGWLKRYLAAREENPDAEVRASR